MKAANALRKLDRLLLTIYLIAMCVLLLSPIDGPSYKFLGIGADKWMHVALFGGLAALFRWNLLANHRALVTSVGAAFFVAALAELVQGLATHRSADLWDLLAGLLGAMLGATSMNRIVSPSAPEKLVGLLTTILGLMVAVLFVFADVIGVGKNNNFGAVQISGMVLGALVVAGGIRLYLGASRNESRPSRTWLS
jgi:hypothetical protein